MGFLRKRLVLVITACLTLVLFIYLSWPRQEGDPEFDARVQDPAFPDHHPRVLFDEAHVNLHTPENRYKPFADLMRSDGYLIIPNKKTFTADVLAGYDILVIANALGLRGTIQQLLNIAHLEGKIDLTRSAFSQPECDAVQEWVKRGGSLLLISDHAPAGAAAGQLSSRFGVGMTNWYAEDQEPNHDPVTKSWAFLMFSRQNGLLLDHPITRGRHESERINRVITFTGQSLKPPPGSISFLKLSPTAREYPTRRSPDNAFRSAGNLAQGVALEYGNGRVVVLGEAAVLTSQLARTPGRTFHFGMGWPDCDDRQLALNIMHWLSRLLN